MEIRNVVKNLASHTILVGIISFVNGVSYSINRDQHINACVQKILKREFTDPERTVITKLATRLGKLKGLEPNTSPNTEAFDNPFSEPFKQALKIECAKLEGFLNCNYVITEKFEQINVHQEKIRLLNEKLELLKDTPVCPVPVDPQGPYVEELLKPYCEQKINKELSSLLWRPALFIFGGIFAYWALSKLQTNDRMKQAKVHLAAEEPPKSPLTPETLK